MAIWWESLDLLSRILYCIAIPTSLILIIQTILIIIGFGEGGAGINPSDTSGLDLDIDAGTDIDVTTSIDTDFGEGSPPGDFSALRVFTIQGAVAFLTVFSWTSISLYHSGISGSLSLIIGFVAGLAAMLGVAKIIQLMSKLASSGNISLENAIGETARVYLSILPGKHGKVTLTVQERLIEVEAISDTDVELPTGTMVHVVGIRSGILVVEKQ